MPKSLKFWFYVHGIVDFGFALPLMLFPAWTLQFFGFHSTELTTARLVSAALFAIGGISFGAHSFSRETFEVLLRLKLLWSGFAMLALAISLFRGAPKANLILISIFGFFFGVWQYYNISLEKTKAQNS